MGDSEGVVEVLGDRVEVLEEVRFRRGTSLEALDDGGGIVARHGGSQAGWPDDIC